MLLAPDLAREPRPPSIGNRLAVRAEADPPAEEELDLLRHPDREEAGVLEEEGALLGEEEVEAVEVDLQLVHLDLGEVGVVRWRRGSGSA